jgi:DNA primase large subunit
MKFYAMYPFLQGAEEFVKERKIDLDMLLTDMAYEPARVRGKERVREAVENGEVGDRPFPKEVEQLAEVLSYPIARMIVSCSGDRYLISRYALGEAMLLERRLTAEDNDDLLVIAEELGVETKAVDKEHYMIHFTTYLHATSSIRAKEWKLVNQEIFSGMVRISKEKLARVLRQMLYDRINSELPRKVTDGIISAFGEDANSYSAQMEAKRKQFVEGEMGPVDDSCFPPCMKTILTMMRAGENVPHSGRFAITSFLHTIGMNADKIMELFSTAPDFDAGKSEYQVRHIVGEISGTEYSPPECSTMKSYGVCYNPDQLCQYEWMTHPLKYYRGKQRRKKSWGERSPNPREPLKGGGDRREDEDDEKDVEKGDGEA